MESQDDDWRISLRRLFRPPLDSLPISEQLEHYHKRDFLPSHLFRIGLDLFGKNQDVRKRVIVASRPATHDSAIRPGEREQEVTRDSKSRKPIEPAAILSSSISSDRYTSSGGLDYRKWIAERKALRNNLEHFGDCEKWLMSKNCTEVERSVLDQFKIKKKTGSLTENPSATLTKVCLVVTTFTTPFVMHV